VLLKRRPALLRNDCLGQTSCEHGRQRRRTSGTRVDAKADGMFLQMQVRRQRQMVEQPPVRARISLPDMGLRKWARPRSHVWSGFLGSCLGRDEPGRRPPFRKPTLQLQVAVLPVLQASLGPGTWFVPSPSHRRTGSGFAQNSQTGQF